MFNHKKVTVKIDRPLGTFHPEHKDLYYPINYCYIRNQFKFYCSNLLFID